MTLEEERRAAKARIRTDAARLMVEHPEFTVDQCLWMAIKLEEIMYGVPGTPTPSGILGHSPIREFK